MRKNFVGSRIIKTGVAIFITAFICELLGWSPVFAVITAIVTIEPTVADSIRKGAVRFPASAIGSAFAVIFISLFGNSPITYTLAAVATIAICYWFKLYEGLLVATITSVAMIEVTSTSLLMTFFIRLGTTTIGLLVSTIVNMLIFPPNYRGDISRNITKLADETGTILKATFDNILFKNKKPGRKIADKIIFLQNELIKIEQFIHFERDEIKYHFFWRNNNRDLIHANQQKDTLRRILDHLDNLRDVVVSKDVWNENEKKVIHEAINVMTVQLQNDDISDPSLLEKSKKQIILLFWKDSAILMDKENNELTSFPSSFTMIYELLAIIDEIEVYIKTLKNI